MYLIQLKGIIFDCNQFVNSSLVISPDATKRIIFSCSSTFALISKPLDISNNYTRTLMLPWENRGFWRGLLRIKKTSIAA